MKVIEKNIIEALKRGKALKAENTTVMFEDTASGFLRADVSLYGTRIATVTFHSQRAADGTMLPRECELTFGGYPTAMTRSRINAVAFWVAGVMPASLRGNKAHFDASSTFVMHGKGDSVVHGIRKEMIEKIHGVPCGFQVFEHFEAEICYSDEKSQFAERKGYINRIAEETRDDRTTLTGEPVLDGCYKISIVGDDRELVVKRAQAVVAALRKIENVTIEG